MKKAAPFFIILAGSLWGCMGIFVRTLNNIGLSTSQTAFIRLTSAAIILFVFLLIYDKTLFKIKLKDIPLLATIGFFSLLCMSCFYFTTISLTSMSTAAILLYTSPVIVMILSIIFFKEKISGIKIISLVLAVSGCALVAGIGDATLTLTGFLTGIGSALAYALYSILGTFALKKHRPFTITFYAFLFAAIGSFFIANPIEVVSVVTQKDVAYRILICVLSGIFSAVAPYVLFTLGLRYIEASKAAIIACVEPLIATLLGIIVYGESLTFFSGAGICLILGAIVLLNSKNLKKA